MNKALRNLILFVLVVLIGAPTGAFAMKDDLDKNFEKKVYTYFSIDHEDNLIFNEKKAIQNGESDEFMEIANKILEIGDAYQAYENEGGNSRAIAFPVYGNWCGPGYGSGIAIDNLDAACRSHDYCYRDYYYHKCKCDTDFHSRVISGLRRGLYSGSEKTAAYGIRGWLAIKTRSVTSTGGNFSCRL